MLEQALFPPYAEKVVIEAGFHQPNAGASNDPLHLEYSKTITKSRNNFYRVVEGASRGNHELKNDYNEAYKTFKAYLDTTIDMVEHLPKQVGYLLPFFYKSGQLGADLNTSQDGKKPELTSGTEASVIVETILARWAYAMTIYNSLVLPQYTNIDIQPNFSALSDGLKQLVKSSKDALLRLKKIEKILPVSLVTTFVTLGASSCAQVRQLPRTQSQVCRCLHYSVRDLFLQRHDCESLGH